MPSNRGANVGKAARGIRLHVARARSLDCGQRHLVFGFGLVERGLADELLIHQTLSALVIRARAGQRGFGLRNRGASPRHLRIGIAGIESRQHLSAPDAVAGVDEVGRDAPLICAASVACCTASMIASAA